MTAAQDRPAQDRPAQDRSAQDRSAQRRPVRIANSSGFYGDRAAAARDMVEGGPIDVLTGDYLAELTMLILWKAQQKDPATGYARTVLTQLEHVLGTCLDRGIKIVNNAGGLNPAGLAREFGALAGRLGLHPKISYVTGDDLLPRLGKFLSNGQALAHLDTGQPLSGAGGKPVTANAYLGGWGITEALAAGADIVVCPRVTDASLVTGPAAWWHGWRREDFGPLAGAVVAGHVIECGPQATGGNYSFLDEITDRRYPGFPIAEVAADGSSVITKHPGTGGLVSPGTVTAQLLYEIAGAGYANPDVVAHFDTVTLGQDGPDRVRLSGTRGSAPPATAKVAINFLGGYRNTMTLVLTGLDIEEKAVWAEQELFGILGGRDQFADVDVRLLRFDRPDAPTNEQATAHLRITVKDPDPRKVGRRFSNATMELALGGYAGFHTTTPPTPESAYGVYWPALVPAAEVPHAVVLPDGTTVPITPTVPAPSAVSAAPGAADPEAADQEAAAPRVGAAAGTAADPSPGRSFLARWAGSAPPAPATRAATPTSGSGPATRPPTPGCATTSRSAGSGCCCPSAPRSKCAASSCPTSARSTSSSSACWGRAWPPPPGRTPRPRAWASICVPVTPRSRRPCSDGARVTSAAAGPTPAGQPGEQRSPGQQPPDQRRRDPRRRQRILTAAAELVAERGYQQVGMADIGAAAGITGSAIYRHFDGKSAVLVAMFDHVIDDLSREAGEIVGAGGDALVILRGLIATQVRFVLRDRTLAQVYHNEVANLPEEDRHRLRRKQRLYIEEWVHVLAQLRPDAGDATVRALVHASVGAIQSVLFYQSGLADDQLATLMSSVAETSMFAALLPRGDDPPLRLPGGLPPEPPAPDSRLGEDTPSARLPSLAKPVQS